MGLAGLSHNKLPLKHSKKAYLKDSLPIKIFQNKGMSTTLQF